MARAGETPAPQGKRFAVSRDVSEIVTSDEELAYRARQGCATSFEQLLRRFQAPLLHFLRHRGFSADAEDLAQETFLRAYENLHRYDRRWAFSTWLFTIARRTSLNHHRRTRPTADTRVVDAVLSAERVPLENMVAEESRRRLWDRAAEVLSEEQTTALWLHYVEDMPAREIARVLGRSWASVKVMLFRARKRLLPLLGEFASRSAGVLPANETAGETPALRPHIAGETPALRPHTAGETPALRLAKRPVIVELEVTDV
jgi:RNA polymerase sigma-70 factor (ECF subfamily)